MKSIRLHAIHDLRLHDETAPQTTELLDTALKVTSIGICGSDLHWFEVVGCDRLGDEAARLRECYRTYDHEAAREILAWIDGGYRSTIDLIDVNS